MNFNLHQISTYLPHISRMRVEDRMLTINYSLGTVAKSDEAILTVRFIALILLLYKGV